MNILEKLWKKGIFRAPPYSIWFNLRHLPLRQAIHLPILLYKAKVRGNGRFIIEGKIKPGMIRLGFYSIGIFPNDGITIENCGEIRFKGRAIIANHSFVSVSDKGRLEIGDRLEASVCKIVCFDNIVFENNVSVGWGSLYMDTDLHKVKYLDGRESKGHGPIHIGPYCWLGNGVKVYKNVTLPHNCIVGSDTILNKNLDFEPYSLICNERTTVTKIKGIYRDRNDDRIKY